MGGTYITGLASHWRDLERESGRDIFLKSYLQPKPSREIQKTTYEQCCSYLDVVSTMKRNVLVCTFVDLPGDQ